MKYIFFILLVIFIASVNSQNSYKNVELLDLWTDTSFAAAPENIRFNDLTGFYHNNQTYAVIGSSIGSHVIKIENNKLEFVDFVPGKFQNIIVEHRDYAVYKNYLYSSCDEGSSSLQIIDLSYLPDSVSLIYDSDILFQTAHTIYIDTAKSKLYACGTNNAAMKIIDLSSPTNPFLISDFTGVTYVHDCFVANDTAFLNCGFDGLRIYRFSTSTPQLLGILDFYNNQGYNHSGYLSKSRRHYAFTDETVGTKIKLCNITSLAEIKIDEEFASADYVNNMPHDVVLLENLAICSYYKEGLRIFDVANKPIREIAHYDTYLPNSAFKFNGAWGVFVFQKQNLILISDRQSGLYLFYFPIHLFEHGNNSTYVTNTPFIDFNSILISREHFKKDNLYFSIYTSTGAVIYKHESYNNWVNIPLNINAGTYLYGVFDEDRNVLESGKFIKAN